MADKKNTIMDFFEVETDITQEYDSKSGTQISNKDTTVYPKENIVDLVSKDDLRRIGELVIEGETSDKATMSDWIKGVEMGLELIEPDYTPNPDSILENGTNFKSQVTYNACLKFGDRISTEILRRKNLVDMSVTDEKPTEEEEERADRLATYENYQINEAMPEWRPEQQKLFYDVPHSGQLFKKVFYDPMLGRNNCQLISYPDFTVNNNESSFARLRRFSMPFSITINDCISKFNSGLWSKIDLEADENNTEKDPRDILGDESNDEMEGTEGDGYQDFIEQQGYYDLDGDGYEEPYTFVVHKATAGVVRIVPRFTAENVRIKSDKKRMTLFKMIDAQEEGAETSEFKIVYIKPDKNIIPYGFLNDPQGGLLNIGYSHLIGTLNRGINVLTNLLIDAGKLVNNPGGALSKEFRVKNGDIEIMPGEFISLNVDAMSMQNGIMMWPFKEPSTVLYQMLNDMKAEAKELSASADIMSAMGANTPAINVMTVQQEQQQGTNAIVLRLYDSMKQEFKKLLELDGLYGDEEHYMEVVDDDKANFEVDFNLKGLDINPNANPEISSKSLRLQKANAAIAIAEQVAMFGGDVRPLFREYLESIGFDAFNEVVPEEEPIEQVQRILASNPDVADAILEEKSRMDAMTAQEMDQAAQQHEMSMDKAASDLENQEANTVKTLAEAKLKEEQSQTEDLKNDISMQTAAQDIDAKAIDNQKNIIDTQRMELDNVQKDRDLRNGVSGDSK